MQVQRGNDTIAIGDLTYGVNGDSLALRLLKHNVPAPTQYSWRLMWRNCYATPRGMELEDLNIKVFKGLQGAETAPPPFVVDYQEVAGVTQSYLKIFGLDQYNQRGQKIPDSRVDDRPEIYRPDWGLLIFPEREPFNSSHTFTDATGYETQALQETVPDIYTDPGQQPIDASRYFIRFVTYPPFY